MYEGFDWLSFFVGLPLGLVIFGIVYFFAWRKGKKERIFDERYKRVHRHGRSISWMVTSITILIGWTIIMIVEGPRLAFFILTGIWVAHMMSYLIGAAIANGQN